MEWEREYTEQYKPAPETPTGSNMTDPHAVAETLLRTGRQLQDLGLALLRQTPKDFQTQAQSLPPPPPPPVATNVRVELPVARDGYHAPLENPWRQLPEEPPYVLPQDRRHIEAWNAIYGSDDRFCVRVDLLPEPANGPRDAPVVFLALNPSFQEGDIVAQRDPAYRAKLRRDIMGESKAHWGLSDEHAGGPGARWWRPRWRAVVEASGLTFDQLAHRLLSVEYFPYVSKSYKELPSIVPSQAYGFSLVRKAMDRGAPIVLIWGWRYWSSAVPELAEYPRMFRASSAQDAYVTPKNIGPDGFRHVVAAVRG